MTKRFLIDGGCPNCTQLRIGAVSVANWKRRFVPAAARQAGPETPN